MKQKIKLRLWNPEMKVLTGGLELNSILYTTDKEFVKEFNRAQMVWMQFTGINDKNGTEIYDGDIVLFTSLEEESFKGVIYFADCAWMVNIFDGIKDWKDWLFEYCGDEHYYQREVIGNIYNNPELLDFQQVLQKEIIKNYNCECERILGSTKGKDGNYYCDICGAKV